MKGKSLGWLLLVGALAVPAVLFYKWWTQMKATQGVEARQAVPAAAPFSGAAPSGAPDGGPTAPVPQPGEGSASAAAPEAPSAAPVEAPLPLAPAPAVAPAEPAPAPSEPAEPEEPPQGETPQNPMLAKIEYMPKTSRDPMLSVADQRELLKRRMAAEISRQEVQKAAEEPEAPPPPPPKPLCDNFELQGIIGTGGTIAAIVNDRIVREGDAISGAVVDRLTTRTVVFRKGKKTCMKRVSK